MLACHLSCGDGADGVVLRVDGALADREHLRGVFGGESAGKLDESFGKSSKCSRTFSLLLSVLLSPRLSHRTQCHLSILTCNNGT